MSRYQLRKGRQAAAWLREWLCTRRSPYIRELAEEHLAQNHLHRSKHSLYTSKFSPHGKQLPFTTGNHHAEESIAKRNLRFAEDPTSKICNSKFHSTSIEKPFSCRVTAHRTSSSFSSRLLVGATPSAKSFRGFRFYYTDSRSGLQHFQRRTFRSGKWSTRQYVLVGIAATGLSVSVYFSNREVVPYTYRKHFVLIPPDFEVEMVQSQFQALKKEWSHHILPSYHPESIRVRRIAKDIIKAVLEGVQEDSDAMQLEFRGKVRNPKQGDMDVFVQRTNTNFPVSAQWGSKEEVLDDRWMEKSRQKGLREGSKPYVEHLKHAKWEVLIVDKDIVNAFCLPGGKIVVFTGLLRRFPSDEDIATVLGHEVAHVVARHSAERMTRHLYVTLLQLFLLAFLYAPDLVQSISVLFLELPFSRRQELEADHIGLLLMAAAGYDPRTAPRVYEKLGELGGTSAELLQYVTTHPSGKKRGERLRSTGTMDEAMKIYERKVGGTVTEGFLRLF